MSKKKDLDTIYVSDTIISSLKLILDPVDTTYLDYFLYIPNLIYSLTIFTHDDKKRDKYIRLNAQLLQKVIGPNAKKITDFLINNGFIETTGKFVKGEYSRSYRLTEKYQKSKFKQKKTFIQTKRVKETNNPERNFVLENMKKVTLNKKAARKSIQNSEKDDIAKEKCLERIDAFADKKWFFTTCRKSGRIFNNVTNCPKETRQHLSYRGQKLVELDIVNSQPLLLASLYKTDSEESKRFKNIVEHLDLYDYILAKKFNQDKKMNRKIVKGRLYEFLFGRGFIYETIKPIETLFIDEFPELFGRIKEVKLGSHKNLPILLQKLEANAMIDYTVKFARERKMFVLTVHDSILCLPKHERALSNHIKLTFNKLYKLNPQVTNKEEAKRAKEIKESLAF